MYTQLIIIHLVNSSRFSLYYINSLLQDWIFHGEVQGKPTTIQLDAGTRCNIMSKTTFENLKLYSLSIEQSSAKMKSYSGHLLKTSMATVPVKINDKINSLKYQIVDLKAETILSANTSKNLNIVNLLQEIQYPPFFFEWS